MEFVRLFLGFLLFFMILLSYVKACKYYHNCSSIFSQGGIGVFIPFMHKDPRGKKWAVIYWILWLVAFSGYMVLTNIYL